MKLLLLFIANLWFITSMAAPVPADSPLRHAPRVATQTHQQLPEAELIGTPEVRVLLGYTRRVLRLHDGHTLGVLSFSGSGDGNWLFLIDGRNLSVQRYPIPHNDMAAHGAAVARDGDIYLISYGSGRSFRFDTRERRFASIQVDLPKEEYTWDAIGASNGCIYFGTYPSATFGEFNPATGKTRLWKQVVPDTKYISNMSEDAKGRVRFRAWGPASEWMTFDPGKQSFASSTEIGAITKRNFRSKTKPLIRPSATFSPSDGEKDGTNRFLSPPEGDERFECEMQMGPRRFALSFPTSRLWEIESDGGMTLCGDAKDPAAPWWLEEVEGGIVGISHFGTLFRYEPANEKFTRAELPNRVPGGNPIMFVETVTSECVIGGNYSQQNLFKIDPASRKMEQCDFMVARVTGESMCAVGLNGRGYLGIYISGILSVYDPRQPFAYGKNPRELIQLEPIYKQTRPRDAVTDGRLVFISSESSYNQLGGALSIIEPATEQVEVYHHLIEDQNLPTLAYDSLTRLLWGGTDRWGQMRSHPPTQTDSVIYAFDIAQRKVVARLSPWKGADVTSVLGISTNGVLIASAGEEIALIDTVNREVLYKGKSPIGIPGKVRLGTDGQCYGLFEGKLHRWDLRSNVLSAIATTAGCTFLTESSPGTWVLANSRSIYRLRIPQN